MCLGWDGNQRFAPRSFPSAVWVKEEFRFRFTRHEDTVSNPDPRVNEPDRCPRSAHGRACHGGNLSCAPGEKFHLLLRLKSGGQSSTLTGPNKRSKTMDPEKKQFAFIVGGVTAALLLAVLAFSAFNNGRALDQMKTDLEQAQSDLEQARSSLASRDTELGDLKGRLTESETRIVKLEKDKDTATQSRQSLESEMRAALESKDVTISRLQGKLTVNILDRVLFDSGEAELKPDGQEVLRKVAAVLAQHTTLKIHVIGHTDNVPIRPTNRRFASNWELSAGRATSAVRFLVETAGVDPRRVGAVAYGEFRPVADNSTPDGRARNRRIAITVLSDEAAGLDTLPNKAGSTSMPPEGIQQTNATPSVTNTSEGTVSPSPADTNAPAAPPQ